MTPWRGKGAFLQTPSVTISSYGYTGDKSVLPLKSSKKRLVIYNVQNDICKRNIACRFLKPHNTANLFTFTSYCTFYLTIFFRVLFSLSAFWRMQKCNLNVAFFSRFSPTLASGRRSVKCSTNPATSSSKSSENQLLLTLKTRFTNSNPAKCSKLKTYLYIFRRCYSQTSVLVT